VNYQTIELDKNKIKNIIEEKIKDLALEIDELRQIAKPIEPENAIGRISRMDAINNKSINDRMLRNSLQKLKNLKTGLKRLENIDFGICIQCKREININRLLLIPETLNCVKCS
jgi:DnaK suppressor protein